MRSLETPVLSLAIDAVCKIDGESALCCLLTLFSKCKDGLQDGQRLENMAWRLWSVERLSCHYDHSLSTQPDDLASPVSSSSSRSPDETDSSSDGESDQDQATAVHDDDTSAFSCSPPLSSGRSLLPTQLRSRQDPTHAQKSHRSLSTASCPPGKSNSYRRPSISARRAHSSTSVGKILADLLPEKLDVHHAKKVSTPTSERDRWRESSSTIQILPETDIVQAPDVVLLQPPEQPTSPSRGPNSAEEQSHPQPSTRFPTVVIESPTPHPTPPLSPQQSPHTSSKTNPQHPLRGDSLSVPPLRTTPRVVSAAVAGSQEVASAEAVSSATLSNASAGSASSQADRYQQGDNGVKPPMGTEATGNADRPTHNPFVLHTASQATANPTLPPVAPANPSTSNAVSPGPMQPQQSQPQHHPSGQSNARKFFIAQHGSPDGDSPDSGSSSQGGSRASESIAASVSAETGGEPASVSSHLSRTSDTKSQASYSSSKSRPRMRRKGSKYTGKFASQAVQRTTSSTRLAHFQQHQQQQQQAQRPHPLQQHEEYVVNGKGKEVAFKVGEDVLVPERPLRRVAPNHRSQPELSRPVLGPAAVKVNGLPSPLEPAPQVANDAALKRRATQDNHAATNGAAPVAGPSQTGKGRIVIDSSEGDDTTEWESTSEGEEDSRDAGEESHSQKHRAGVSQNGNGSRSTEASKLAEAAAEAQRQRNLFEKMPRRSYTNLNRSQSGLLSTIFHPDPNRFPPDHPYRYTQSSADILAHFRGGHTQGLYAPPPLPQLTPAKAPVAAPVAAPVTAEGVGSPNKSRRSPLRLKGGPPDADMEDSDSDGEDDDNKIPISESQAKKRLAELHNAHKRSPSQQVAQQQRRQEQQKVPPLTSQLQQLRDQQLPTRPPNNYQLRTHFSQQQIYPGPAQGAAAPQLTSVATAPMHLGYPYDLNPAPALPSTPRTIRRKMLAEELSESLRRNLLWERQVSKQRPLGLMRRPATAGTTSTNGAVNGGTRPNGAPQANGNAAVNGVQQQQPAQNGDAAIDERKRKALERMRSADEFHRAGW